jgi:UDP-N-acetylglucosamine diphosphorylase / glucose-1-phosphate thymidylyltransferase / UDP-N-acetylgalactosamine diphosphorylase / glucosamine-1-phosphate N-acetyltransferase / galactosamine-1-phosphate N-acetyltransferase
MKAVILAAGEGKRLRPFTETMPKVMLPVANKPILEYVVDSLKKAGVNEIVIVVGYKKEVVMEYFKDYKDISVKFAFQDKQLGTAHALLQAKDYIDDSFLVLSGDNIIDSNGVSNIIDDSSSYSMMIKEHSHPSKYGVVFLKNGNLDEIVKQPQEDIGNFISTGIYKFPVSIFDKIEDFASKGDYSLFSIIQSLVDEGKTIGTVRSDLWMDVVYPWDLIDVNSVMVQDYSKSCAGVIEKNVTLKGSVYVGKDTTVSSGCYIVGPVVIGKGCEIGPNTCIFPSTSIGDNVVVEPLSEIRNSIIMDDCKIGSHSFISHSVIGKGNVLENGFSTIVGDASLEVDTEFLKIKDIGALVGDNNLFKSYVVVDSGVIIGRNCHIRSLKKIMENVASGSEVM